MRILVTGATGFVGSYIVRQLIDNGETVRCLIRSESNASNLDKEVETALGDVLDVESLSEAFSDIDAVIHLVGIIKEERSAGITFERLHIEATRNVTEAAARAKVSSFTHMSANGARKDGVSRYQTTKWQAEQIVMNAGFNTWTIFRPSFVFGDPGNNHPEFVKQMAQSLVVPFPILPVFGNGKYLMQPVSVKDLAKAFAMALKNEPSKNRIYTAVGKDSFTYNELLDIIAQACGLKPKKKIHQPLMLARLAVNTIGKVGLIPITPDQFEMLIEGNTGNPIAFHEDFGLEGIPFTVDNLSYVRKYISEK